ncbi:hypothetical protein A8A01_03225 [Ewingella americana]|nr:hypothetical protein A8A01_03225 [Ewingella americana]
MKELKEFTVERLEIMHKSLKEGLKLGFADALILKDVVKIALAAKRAIPAYWITYYPNPNPDEFDDREHSHSGPESCARRIAKEIGGHVVPVYHGTPPLNHTEQDEYWYEVECYKYKGPARLCAGNTGPAWYFPGSDLLVDNDEVKVIGRTAAPKPESE